MECYCVPRYEEEGAAPRIVWIGTARPLPKKDYWLWQASDWGTRAQHHDAETFKSYLLHAETNAPPMVGTVRPLQ